MADRRVAFLRGLNVGGHRVKMTRLKSIFEAEGLAGVATYIASGNVVFDDDGRAPEALEELLEDALQRALGYEVKTFLRTIARVRAVGSPPWLADVAADGFKVHAMFLKEAPDDAMRAGLAEIGGPDDVFRADGRVVYWLRRGGLSESTIKAHHLKRALQGRPNTVRNLNTVAKIAAKFS